MGTDKVAMRRRLEERGIPVPLFYVVSSKDEYLDAISKFPDKAIVKAADSSGYVMASAFGDFQMRFLNEGTSFEKGRMLVTAPLQHLLLFPGIPRAFSQVLGTCCGTVTHCPQGLQFLGRQ